MKWNVHSGFLFSGQKPNISVACSGDLHTILLAVNVYSGTSNSQGRMLPCKQTFLNFKSCKSEPVTVNLKSCNLQFWVYAVLTPVSVQASQFLFSDIHLLFVLKREALRKECILWKYILLQNHFVVNKILLRCLNGSTKYMHISLFRCSVFSKIHKWFIL